MKNIITSCYQITEVFKSVISIREHTGGKDDRKEKWLDDQEINITDRLKSEKSAKKFSYTKFWWKRTIFECILQHLNSEGISENFKELLSLFFGYLYKNKTERASCGETWFLKRILYTAGI